jgi:hypothetical protein
MVQEWIFPFRKIGFPAYDRNGCGLKRTGKLPFTALYQQLVTTDCTAEVPEHG